MDPVDVVRLQIALEYRIDDEGCLAPFPGSAERARYVVSEHPGGHVRFYRHDVPASVRRRLEELPPQGCLRLYGLRGRVPEGTRPLQGGWRGL